MPSYPQSLRFAPKKPFAWVLVAPFVIAPRVTTGDHDPSPASGHQCAGGVGSRVRLDPVVQEYSRFVEVRRDEAGQWPQPGA